MVEVAIPSDEAKEVSVYISDSMGEDVSLSELSAEVHSANADLLAASFNPHLPIVYQKAKGVVKQNNT